MDYSKAQNKMKDLVFKYRENLEGEFLLLDPEGHKLFESSSKFQDKDRALIMGVAMGLKDLFQSENDSIDLLNSAGNEAQYYFKFLGLDKKIFTLVFFTKSKQLAGKTKHYFNLLAQDFEMDTQIPEKKEHSEQETLFENIQDEEINQMFSRIGI
ncbi:MAG: hypothetical protein ACPGJV_08790 [Bacteriovoracaceae bacterium]